MNGNTKEILKKTVGTLYLPILIYIFFTIMANGRFGGWDSLYGILQQMVLSAIFGWGICFSKTVGIWDFSPAAAATLASLVAADAATQYGIAGIVVAGLLVGILTGILTGVVYSLFKIPSIVVTVGMLLIYEALGTIYKGGKSFTITRSQSILGVSPWIFIIGILSFALAYILMNYTKFGFQVCAVGNNESIAKAAGVNPAKVKFWCFVVSGIFIGIAAIVQLCYVGAIAPKKNMQTMSTVFNSLMAVFIAICLSGNCNRIIGVLVGTFTITALNSGLIAVGIDGTWQQVFTGIGLILFIAITENKSIVTEWIKTLFCRAKAKELSRLR